MSAAPITLEQLLRESAQVYVRNSAIEFLDGKQSFQWITGSLSRFGLPKETAYNVLLPLRNYGDAYRAEALFNWLAKAEW